MKSNFLMVPLVESYIQDRRRLGFSMAIQSRRLLCFARFADRLGHRGPITEELAVRWARATPRTNPIAAGDRLRVLRPFARYRQQFDPETQVPRSGLCGREHRRLTPHIYSPQEVQALMAAARELSPAGELRASTCETVFGLLAATGLRISEAMALRRCDVELDRALLTVRQTKFRKSRQLVLHPTTVEALRRYASVRDRHCPVPRGDAFFLTDAGASMNVRQVQYAFAALRTQLKWSARGGHPAPRIQDMRHTFICRRLLAWYQEGIDVDNAMLSLSTYVGHTQVTHTYWYITGIPELMSIAAQRFERSVRGAAND
jgi:integrase